MCGRYSFDERNPIGVAERLEVRSVPDELVGRANIAPTQEILAVVAGSDGAREARTLRWGLAPRWMPLRGRAPLINARIEQLRSSNAWRPLIASARGRCLIPATGWIEWLRGEDRKTTPQPFLHRVVDAPGGIACFAGLWTTAVPKGESERLSSCAIVTRPAAAPEIVRIHDRQPAVLAVAGAEDAWLDPSVGADELDAVLAPLDPGQVEVHAIGTAINSWEAEGVELLEPIAPA